MARRRKTVRQHFVDESLRALLETLSDEARKNPDGIVARWLGRAMLAILVVAILVVIVVFWGVVTVVFTEFVSPLLSSTP